MHLLCVYERATGRSNPVVPFVSMQIKTDVILVTQISARLIGLRRKLNTMSSDMIETKPRIDRMRQTWTAVSSWLALVSTV